MTANERISQARGDKERLFPMRGNAFQRWRCTEISPEDLPQYDSDPAAWTPEHYQWIEDEGLHEKFIRGLFMLMGARQLIFPGQDGMNDTIKWVGIFHLIKATPLQKATALDRALKERDGS